MLRMTVVAALSIVGLFSLTACVAKPMPAKCSVVGVKYLSSEESASQICASFEEKLAQALAANGGETKGVAVAIELHKRGSAEARVTRKSSDGVIEYPIVAVDVMDRAFEQKDLDRLADAVAQAITEK